MNGDVIVVKYFILEGKVCINSRDWNYKRIVLDWVKMRGIQESILLVNNNFDFDGLVKSIICGIFVEDNV